MNLSLYNYIKIINTFFLKKIFRILYLLTLTGHMTLKLSSEHSPPATKPKPRWPWLLVAALAFTLTYRSTSHHDDYTVCTEGNDIYTVDPHVPRAQCISIREKRIHEIGTYGSSFHSPLHYDTEIM